MLRDKILFVIKLQKLKKQVSFCHPSQRNEHIKMWETHANDYWVFSKMADFLSLIPYGLPLFKTAAGSNFPPWGEVQDVKFPTHMRFTESTPPLPPPPHPFLIGALLTRISNQQQLRLQ